MSPRCAPDPTIQEALREFLEERDRTMCPEKSRLYRHVVFFLQLCINNYGHRNLDETARSRYERCYRGADGLRLDFFELFGPELLLPELDFFAETYLHRDVHTSDRVLASAPVVVADLRGWLVERGYVSATNVEEHRQRHGRNARLSYRLRRLVKLASRRLVAVDPGAIAPADYVPCDDHSVVRLEEGRLWVRVYRGASAEEIGPILLPAEITRRLRVGWNLVGALARLRGRWRLVELEEIYPRE